MQEVNNTHLTSTPSTLYQSNKKHHNSHQHIDANEQNQSKFTDRFVIRLPRGLRDCIANIAKFNRRSMNSEIVMLIEEKVSQHRSTEQGNKVDGDIEYSLDAKEAELIKCFRKLSASKQQAILALMG